MPLFFTWGNLADLALSIFLIAVGLGLAFTFVRLAETFSRVSTFVRRTERELLPVLIKVGGTVDRVNSQLDKVDQITDSAVDAVTAVDTGVRTVSAAVRRPVQKLAGLAAGVSYGASSLKTNRSWRGAVQAGKEAAARRERDLEEELRAQEGAS
jgi:uncharacterized protein YoxC